jgi:hypothetical protein
LSWDEDLLISAVCSCHVTQTHISAALGVTGTK